MSAIPSRPQIELSSYPRADILRAFVNRQIPQFSLTCEVDVTALHRACEANGVHAARFYRELEALTASGASGPQAGSKRV